MIHPNLLDQQIENLRTLQQSYDAIAGAAEAYNTGKVELAQNITAKGVQASASETLPELAEKVLDIQQETTVIDGGDMYAAQLFGDGALWNLYDVLAQMKSQFMGAGQYACLIVCEYYKGYDSLQLQGADAYYTCDGDFYDTSMPLHVWHDSDNGKANRWVCFLFATEGARLDITNTAISPRSMYIGGHIGTIEYFVNGRLTDFVCGVEETDKVDVFDTAGFTQEWGRVVSIRNVGMMSPKYQIDTARFVYIQATNQNVITAGGHYYRAGLSNQYIIIGGKMNCNSYGQNNGIIGDAVNGTSSLEYIELPDIEIVSGTLVELNWNKTRLKELIVPKLRTLSNTYYSLFAFQNSSNTSNLINVKVGEMTTNLNIKNWNPTTVLADATKKAKLIDNIKNNILARVSDATGGTQLVFTVSTNVYNEIASENITWNDQTMTLADAFLTKNWLLAGA